MSRLNLFFADGTHLRDHRDLVLAGEAARIARISDAAFQRHVGWGSIVPAGELSSGVKVFRRVDADQLAVAMRRHAPEPFATEDDAATGYVGLTVHQPFASQIANGTKRFEFRTWRLHKLPMRLVICASARKPPKGHEHLPTGCTVALVTVFNCLPLKGGWAWVFKDDVVPLPAVAVRGRQRLFKLSESTLRRRPLPVSVNHVG